MATAFRKKPGPGPGAYDTLSSTTVFRAGTRVQTKTFGHASRALTTARSGGRRKKASPGPGDYDAHTRDTLSAKAAKLAATAPSSVFRSVRPRFGRKPKRGGAGPGQYDTTAHTSTFGRTARSSTRGTFGDNKRMGMTDFLKFSGQSTEAPPPGAYNTVSSPSIPGIRHRLPKPRRGKTRNNTSTPRSTRSQHRFRGDDIDEGDLYGPQSSVFKPRKKLRKRPKPAQTGAGPGSYSLQSTFAAAAAEGGGVLGRSKSQRTLSTGSRRPSLLESMAAAGQVAAPNSMSTSFRFDSTPTPAVDTPQTIAGTTLASLPSLGGSARSLITRERPNPAGLFDPHKAMSRATTPATTARSPLSPIDPRMNAPGSRPGSRLDALRPSSRMASTSRPSSRMASTSSSRPSSRMATTSRPSSRMATTSRPSSRMATTSRPSSTKPPSKPSSTKPPSKPSSRTPATAGRSPPDRRDRSPLAPAETPQLPTLSPAAAQRERNRRVSGFAPPPAAPQAPLPSLGKQQVPAKADARAGDEGLSNGQPTSLPPPGPHSAPSPTQAPQALSLSRPGTSGSVPRTPGGSLARVAPLGATSPGVGGDDDAYSTDSELFNVDLDAELPGQDLLRGDGALSTTSSPTSTFEGDFEDDEDDDEQGAAARGGVCSQAAGNDTTEPGESGAASAPTASADGSAAEDDDDDDDDYEDDFF